MSAQEFLNYLSQAIYLVLFVVAAVRLARRPSWASLDTFLFFAIIATILVVGDLAQLLGFEDHPARQILNWVGISALPYLLLRLADDFRPRPMPVMVGATLGLVVVAAIGILAPQPWNPAVTFVPVAYVVALGLYASLVFLEESRTSAGVTRRRMQAVAIGSGMLAVVLALAGVRIVVPAAGDVIGVLSQIAGVVLVLSYFIGFAPPAFLRRAWQEPTLRAFLSETTHLVRLPDARAVADRIEARAAAATGGDGGVLGLWDEGRGLLVFHDPTGAERVQAPGEGIGGRAFARQEMVVTRRAERDAPEHATDYRANDIHAIVAAPITSDDVRLGVLVVYATRPPLFTDDVLSLVELIAEQAALVLRSHQLLAEAAQVRAMAEVTRLKDDFLSVVAHDVRTPLTTILLNAELLQARAGNDHGDPRQARRAATLRSEALRLKQLVEDYLDVVRSEHGADLRREEHDLVALVREALDGLGAERQRVRVAGDGELRGLYDGPRIMQLVQNLVSNALKYSGPGAPVEIETSADDGFAMLSVTDHGIGIPDGDLPMLFERFHRGTNTDDRRYGGLGLGLYICRQIATAHGGSIAASSQVGEGTTFTVRLRRWPDEEQPVDGGDTGLVEASR